MKTAQNVIFSVSEYWGVETLDDKGETSASNESSVVLYGQIDGKKVLFSGDAGQQALERSADFCDANFLPLQQFRLLSVPHHGSRRNVGPTILDRLIGPKLLEGNEATSSAVVSASKDDEHHPKRVVLNALKRRGLAVATTEGVNIRHAHNAGDRQGFSIVPPLPFYNDVEE